MPVASSFRMNNGWTLLALPSLLAGCASPATDDDGEKMIDGRVMSTAVAITNATSLPVRVVWDGAAAANPNPHFSSPTDVASGATEIIGEDWDWGPVAVWRVVPGLTVSSPDGADRYLLPSPAAANLVPEDGAWTLETCGYPGPCQLVLTVAP